MLDIARPIFAYARVVRAKNLNYLRDAEQHADRSSPTAQTRPFAERGQQVFWSRFESPNGKYVDDLRSHLSATGARLRKGSAVSLHLLLGVSCEWLEETAGLHDRNNPRVQRLFEVAMDFCRHYFMDGVYAARIDLDERGGGVVDLFVAPVHERSRTRKDGTPGRIFREVSCRTALESLCDHTTEKWSYHALQTLWAAYAQTHLDVRIMRGRPKSITGREHLSVDEFKQAVAAEQFHSDLRAGQQATFLSTANFLARAQDDMQLREHDVVDREAAITIRELEVAEERNATQEQLALAEWKLAEAAEAKAAADIERRKVEVLSAEIDRRASELASRELKLRAREDQVAAERSQAEHLHRNAVALQNQCLSTDKDLRRRIKTIDNRDEETERRRRKLRDDEHVHADMVAKDEAQFRRMHELAWRLSKDARRSKERLRRLETYDRQIEDQERQVETFAAERAALDEQRTSLAAAQVAAIELNRTGTLALEEALAAKKTLKHEENRIARERARLEAEQARAAKVQERLNAQRVAFAETQATEKAERENTRVALATERTAIAEQRMSVAIAQAAAIELERKGTGALAAANATKSAVEDEERRIDGERRRLEADQKAAALAQQRLQKQQREFAESQARDEAALEAKRAKFAASLTLARTMLENEKERAREAATVRAEAAKADLAAKTEALHAAFDARNTSLKAGEQALESDRAEHAKRSSDLTARQAALLESVRLISEGEISTSAALARQTKLQPATPLLESVIAAIEKRTTAFAANYAEREKILEAREHRYARKDTTMRANIAYALMTPFFDALDKVTDFDRIQLRGPDNVLHAVWTLAKLFRREDEGANLNELEEIAGLQVHRQAKYRERDARAARPSRSNKGRSKPAKSLDWR